MKRILIVLVAFGLSAAPAQAGPNRTFVSGKGTDSGACTFAAPCRSFAFAINQTAAGGEIDVLDPAVYGPVTIAKAISIDNDGVGTAGIRAAGAGNAITINAGPNDSGHLRGLTIEGLGGTTEGIVFASGGNLAMENCVIRGFGGDRIIITPSASSSFSVSNTIASNNGVGIDVGSFVSAAVVTGVLRKVITNNNSRGISVGRLMGGASLNVTIVDSVASNNTAIGVVALSAAGGPTTVVMVRNSVASNNSTGLEADTNAILRVAHSVVTGNNTGVNRSGGGIINSYGDNDIDGNTNDNTRIDELQQRPFAIAYRDRFARVAAQ